MTAAFPWASALGVGAGVLIIGAGVFVLLARPASPLNRLFFALALTDGASTVLFDLRNMATDAALRVAYHATYWYAYLAFIALLAGFGLAFPRPLGGARARPWLVGATAALGAASILAYAVRHDWFWTPVVGAGGVVRFEQGPGTWAANAAFVGATALLLLKLTREILRGRSATHRRQAALVLGGMILAYAPYATTSFASALITRPAFLLVHAPAGLRAGQWAYAAFTVTLLATALVLLRARGSDGRSERRVVLAAIGGVLALTLAYFARPDAVELLRVLALVAYPVLLGYAIVRYEVFDIDARFRRATAVTVAAVAAAAVFGAVENAAQDLLASAFGTVASPLVAGTVALVATAALGVPIVRVASRLSRRIVPERGEDALRARKLEVYRHGLEGAVADGLLEERESRTLAALRRSLGISDEEHARLVADVMGPRAAAPSGTATT